MREPRVAPASEARIPRATYRLQFHHGFDFDAAVRIVPYLAKLGISHVYCSPITRARPGSLHGYDVVAHDEINPELGGAIGHARLTAALQAHGMSQILDLVPNHMGVLGTRNAWWQDVLENGPASAFAEYFDIDWHPLDAELEGKVLLPVLGESYGSVLASGELKLAFEAGTGRLALNYHDHHFPLDPRSYGEVLALAAEACGDAEAGAALVQLADRFTLLPARDDSDTARIALRRRVQATHLEALAALATREPAAAQGMAAALEALHAEGPRNALHALLDAQAWRLAHWRVASDEINYRRFFDINELAALRVEDEAVFEATHHMAIELAARGAVQGFRIDHPDGLHDPARYFERLQAGYGRRVMGEAAPGADGPNDGPPAARAQPFKPIYVVAEKILAPHESIPTDWAAHGGTGYRFMNAINGVLVATGAEARIDRIWRHFSGVEESFEALALQAKRDVARQALASELAVLSTRLLRIARSDRRTRDHTLNSLRNAIAEVAAGLPVYRTYIVDGASAQDLRYIDWALARARRHRPDLEESVFAFLRRCLLGEALQGAPDGVAEAARSFAMRFQQFSSPVAAKGIEDTAFYRHTRLASLNEVGGDPALFGMTLKAFHSATLARQAHWPHTMLATSTHDNKRSEDLRNRIDVLSELPAAWRLALARWRRMNRSHRVQATAEGDSAAPSAADEYLLYQTLLGAWPASGLDDASLPAFRERIEAYMLKACREAKQHTSWVRPNPAYEDALKGFIAGLLGRTQTNPFLADLQAQAAVVAWYGALNSLTMVLAKYTSPGVPDLYQGNELMDLSLVDPDNRRPVDYAHRAALLDELESLASGNAQAGGVLVSIAAAVAALAVAPHDGRAKLWFTWRLLALRREQPALFERGAYTPLTLQGQAAGHALAYQRRLGSEAIVVIAGRLFAGLGKAVGALPVGTAAWGETRAVLRGWADGTQWRNLLSGETVTVEDGGIRLADAFASLPWAAFVVAGG